VCVCGLRYPECSAHAPCCHLWPVRLYSIFPHYLISGTIFEKKKVTKYKNVVLIFCTTFIRNISHSKKKWARYDHKCLLIFMQSTRYSCPSIMKFEFSRHIFGKYSNIKFNENPSSGSRVVPCGPAD
jgi:hypothetical protein